MEEELDFASEKLEALRADSCIRCQQSVQQFWMQVNSRAGPIVQAKFLHNYACET